LWSECNDKENILRSFYFFTKPQSKIIVTISLSLHFNEDRSTTLTDETKQWESFKAGDSSALQVLYNHYVDSLYSYGMHLCADTDKVRDCIHDLFLSLWDSRRNFAIPNSGKAYLMVSLRRRIFDKGSRIDSLTGQLEDAEENRISDSDHESQWIEAEDNVQLNHRLEKAYHRLSERQREIIHMKYYQQLDYEEIGRVMGLNYQSARNLVNRALAALRKEMLGVVTLLLIFL
jgi:RNA polymerase sigma factor (sigma-70 family)